MNRGSTGRVIRDPEPRPRPLAWLGDPALKEQVVLRMKEHRAEDAFIQGNYQVYAPYLASQYKGCLLGCTLPRKVTANQTIAIHFGWHLEVQETYGILRSVAHALEAIFENLPFEQAADFAVESIEAIPVGADLSAVEEYWISEIEEDKDDDWSACVVRDKVLELLRNAPVPEPV